MALTARLRRVSPVGLLLLGVACFEPFSSGGTPVPFDAGLECTVVDWRGAASVTLLAAPDSTPHVQPAEVCRCGTSGGFAICTANPSTRRWDGRCGWCADRSVCVLPDAGVVRHATAPCACGPGALGVWLCPDALAGFVADATFVGDGRARCACADACDAGTSCPSCPQGTSAALGCDGRAVACLCSDGGAEPGVDGGP